MNKVFHTSEGKRIAVYDGLFDLHFRTNIFLFVSASLFRLGWGDSQEFYKRNHMFLHSVYSPDDLHKTKILERIKASDAAAELDGYAVKKAVVNLSTAADSNFIHTHEEDKVLLYYVNMDWQDGWHGETLFYDESKRDVVFASAYTPGRLVSFDAKIPHTIRPQSHIAVPYRFTLALTMDKVA